MEKPKMKPYLIFMGWLTLFLFSMGIACPYLISQSSDWTVALGVVLIIANIYLIILFI